MEAQDFNLPPLAAETALTVSRWWKQPGERVAAREKLLEAHSERFDWDIPAPRDGVLQQIRAGAGSTVAPGETLAQLGVETVVTERAPRISPLAARMARALGVDAASARGSGVAGRILRADVLSLAPGAQPPAPLADTLVPFSAAQRARAAQVVASRGAVPHGSCAAALALDLVDGDRLSRQAAWQKREGFALGRLPYLLAAALAALNAVPEANALFGLEGARRRSACHLALTVTEGADFRPAAGIIRHAEQLSLVGIARRLNAFAGAGEPGWATFRVRVQRGLLATATLAPGESACLTLGAATNRAGVTAAGELIAQAIIHACLTYDARLLDEARAARFLAEMQRVLAEPARAW